MHHYMINLLIEYFCFWSTEKKLHDQFIIIKHYNIYTLVYNDIAPAIYSKDFLRTCISVSLDSVVSCPTHFICLFFVTVKRHNRILVITILLQQLKERAFHSWLHGEFVNRVEKLHNQLRTNHKHHKLYMSFYNDIPLALYSKNFQYLIFQFLIKVTTQ
jgi:hypothetical protein